MNEFYRGRRLRRNPVIREMVRETQLSAADLMMLYFVVDTTDEDFKKEIPSMPGQYQLSLKQLEKTVGEAVDAGLRSLMLFGIPKHKDAIASEAYAPNGIVQRAIRMLKAKWPDLQVVTDVCLCEYTSHGHCGILKEGDTCGEVVNDPTLELLAKTALSHVEAGADMVAPSDMMDGRILAIRETLDKAGYVNTPIMSYAVKYASAFYGPFRDAAESAPHHGDRKTYQMDPANAMEGLREAAADIDEGADIVCAAVTSAIRLVESTVNDVMGLCASVKVREKDTKIIFRLPGGLSAPAESTCQNLLTGLMVYLTQLHDEYPENIEVMEE